MQYSSTFQRETAAMKKLKGLKCNGDTETGFGHEEMHSEMEGKSRDNNLGKNGRKEPLGERRQKTKLVWSEEREQTDDQENDTF